VTELPHDLDAEQVMLGALMSGAVLDEVRPLTTACFYRAAHQLIYEAIEALTEAGRPTDPVAVNDELRRRGQLTRMGGAPYLHTCIQSVPAAAAAGYYASIVREHAERRQLIEHAERILQAAADPREDLATVRGLADATSMERPAIRGGTPASQFRHLVLTRASDIDPLPVLWGWDDRMPAGHVSLIPGREGIGKSLFLTWLTAQLTKGTLPGAYFGSPRAVFYCATEDSWQKTIVPRLIAAGADRDLVYRVEVETVETNMLINVTLPRDCDLLAAEVKRLEVAMISLDPLMSAIDQTVDTYNDRDMRTVLEPLGKLADDTGCMIAGLAHFNKSADADPLNLVTGSRAFTAVVRAVIAIARDPDADDGTCVVSQVKNNLGRLDLPNLTYVVQQATIETVEGDAKTGRLYFTGESERGVRDILAEAGNGAERTERAECMDWLKQELATPRRTKEIEAEGRERGYSQRTQWRARKQLCVKADQLSTGKGGKNEWWLSLPAGLAGSHEPA
jgi:hypothetical protein